ncbi:hypothetical protein AB0368_18885 [Actinoplanes sp. NPDC051475]
MSDSSALMIDAAALKYSRYDETVTTVGRELGAGAPGYIGAPS